MTLKLGINHQVLEYYQVCSNYDPEMTLTYLTARSNLVFYAFVWETGKTMDFSETIVANDTRVAGFQLGPTFPPRFGPSPYLALTLLGRKCL